MIFQTLVSKAAGDSGAKYGDIQLSLLATYTGTPTSGTVKTYNYSTLRDYVLNDLTEHSVFFVASSMGEPPLASGVTQIGNYVALENSEIGTVYYGLFQWTDLSTNAVFTKEGTSGTSGRYNVTGLIFNGSITIENISSWNDDTTDESTSYVYKSAVPKDDDYPLLIMFNILNLGNTSEIIPSCDGMIFDKRTHSNSGRFLPIIAYGPEGNIWLNRTNHNGLSKSVNYAQCLYFKIKPTAE